MDDLTLTRLCAEAMGHYGCLNAVVLGVEKLALSDGTYYDPFHDDAQAMALVKKFKPRFGYIQQHGNYWYCEIGDPVISQGRDPDLNRAIVECVAKMRKP